LEVAGISLAILFSTSVSAQVVPESNEAGINIKYFSFSPEKLAGAQ